MFDVSTASLLGMRVAFDCIACLRSMVCDFVFIVYLNRRISVLILLFRLLNRS